MKDRYEEPIPRRRRRRKLRIGRVLFTFLTIIFIGTGLYSYFQYQAGKALTAQSTIDPGQFSGDLLDLTNSPVENYLLLGIDDDDSGKSRTDTMMVLSWNRQDGEMKLISFMRDIYADIPGYKSYKLNTAYYLGGVQTAKDTITGMFDIPIHHYAIVNFDRFESLIDIAFPKGVEMNVQKEMSEKIGVTLQPGVRNLNGKELLGYARFRADAEGDFGRVARQQEVISAIKSQGLRPTMVPRLPKIAGAIAGLIESDLSTKDELSRAFSLARTKGSGLEVMTVPIEGSYSFNSYSHAGSVIEIDIEKNRAAIASFLNNSTH